MGIKGTEAAEMKRRNTAFENQRLTIEHFDVHSHWMNCKRKYKIPYGRTRL